MAGAAVTTTLQQLKGLLNITHFTSETEFIPVMKSVFGHIDEWNWRSTVIGLAFSGFLIATKILGQKKKLFWVPAIAPLTSAILSTLFVSLTRADKHGVKIVGHFKKEIDPVSAHQCLLSGSVAASKPKIGLIASLIALTEGGAIGRVFAALRGYHIDGNKGIIAFGVMNICGSVTTCYVASGLFSRAAVNYQAGVYIAMPHVIMSIVMLITLLLLKPLFKYTPNIILSVIIISAVLSLIDLRSARLIWKIDKFDFLACLGAFVGVSVEIGLLVAMCFSFVKLLYNVTRPHTTRLGTVVTNVYRNVTQYPTAALVPGVLAIREDAAIYFSNSNSIHDKTLHYLEEKTQKLAETGGALFQYLIVDSTPVTNIDSSGIIALEELEKTLKQKNIELAFANPGALVISKLDDSKFLAHLSSGWLFFIMSEAIQVCTMLLNQAAAERQV